MLGSNFYWGTLKKYVILFGSLFSDISISRLDASGNVAQSQLVPISYGPRERYMVRARQNPDTMRPISMVFPRMAFQIEGFEYDADRKLNTIGIVSNGNPYNGTLTTQYNSVPWNINFSLSIICRNTEDGLMIIEQILPYFTPEWTTVLNIMPPLDEQKDIPVILMDMKTEEHYENSFETKQFITWDLTFKMKVEFYGPITRDKIIKTANINFFVPEDTDSIEDVIGKLPVQEHIYIQPGLDANGNPTSIIANSIPVGEISANDNYGFIDEIENDATR